MAKVLAHSPSLCASLIHKERNKTNGNKEDDDENDNDTDDEENQSIPPPREIILCNATIRIVVALQMLKAIAQYFIFVFCIKI